MIQCRNKLIVVGGIFAVFVLMLLIQAVYSISISPLYEFEGYDSAVYEYLGYAWYIGKFPYYDIFEGKGPLLFLINTLGWAIHDRSIGIYLLQSVNYTLVVLLWWKIARLFTDRWKAVLSIVLTLCVYVFFNEEGNLTEDWSMLPISYSMYLLARMVRDKKVPVCWEFFVAGLGAGAVTMIRMNNMPITVVLAFYTMYLLIKDHEYRKLRSRGLCMTAGFIIPILAFTIYFYARWGSLGIEWFYYGTFWYNFDYAKNHCECSSPVLARVAYWGSVVLFLITSRKKILSERRYLVLSLVLYVLSYAVIGKSLYLHYFLIILPVVLFSSCISFSAGDRIIPFVLAGCLVAAVLIGISDRKYLTTNGAFYPPDIYPECAKLVERIPATDRDSVFNYNDLFVQITILKRHKIMQCNRLNGFDILTNSKKLYRETCNQLYEMHPKWFLSTRGWATRKDSLFVTKNYDLVYTTGYDMSRDYEFCHEQMKLYKRKKTPRNIK